MMKKKRPVSREFVEQMMETIGSLRGGLDDLQIQLAENMETDLCEDHRPERPAKVISISRAQDN